MAAWRNFDGYARPGAPFGFSILYSKRLKETR